MSTYIQTATKQVKILQKFMAPSQIETLGSGCRKRDGRKFFFGKIAKMANVFSTMPKTYEQDGKGDNAVAYLHYFTGGCNWYITERDMEDEQNQAFGYANLGYGGELGYISLVELMENNIEVDLYWTPKTLKEIKG